MTNIFIDGIGLIAVVALVAQQVPPEIQPWAVAVAVATILGIASREVYRWTVQRHRDNNQNRP